MNATAAQLDHIVGEAVFALLVLSISLLPGLSGGATVSVVDVWGGFGSIVVDGTVRIAT